MPTRGQLERNISQAVQAIYRNRFGHVPGKVVCRLFDDNLTVIVEDAMTVTEKLLFERGKIDLAQNIRAQLNNLFLTDVREEVSRILSVGVADAIGNLMSQKGHLGIIVFLKSEPAVRLSKKGLGN